jgi:hypothetical protein
MFHGRGDAERCNAEHASSPSASTRVLLLASRLLHHARLRPLLCFCFHWRIGREDSSIMVGISVDLARSTADYRVIAVALSYRGRMKSSCFREIPIRIACSCWRLCWHAVPM